MTDRALTPEARALLESMLAEQAAGSGASPKAEPGLFPLSEAQRRLWSLGALAPDSAWGNLPLCFEVRGPVRVEALAAALRDVVERQAGLRTRYETREDGVWGRVSPVPGRVLEVDPDSSDVDAALRDFAERARAGLDPETGPLFQARWVPAGSERGLLCLLTHHLVTDGWSIGLLLRELAACYAARVAGGAPDLPPIGRDFAAEASAEADREIPQEDVDYWKTRLEGAPPDAGLPGDALPAGADAYRSARTLGRIDPETSAALRRLAASERVTPFAALVGALQILLARYTGRDDVAVGTTVSVRDSAARERLVGNFGNNVLLRTDLSDGPTARDILSRIRETLPRDLAHQRLPLERLLSDESVSGRVPRVSVLFMLRDGSPADHFDLPGCEVTYRAVEIGASTLDLTLDVFDEGERGFSFAVEHRLARLDRPGASALANDFVRTVAGIAYAPDEPVSTLDIRHGCWAGASDASAEEREPGPPEGVHDTRDMTESEAYLAALWREVLDLESVDPLDNFFELGGHSLLAISILERIEESTAVRLTPVDLVSQTLAQLAAAIDEGGGLDG